MIFFLKDNNVIITIIIITICIIKLTFFFFFSVTLCVIDNFSRTLLFFLVFINVLVYIPTDNLKCIVFRGFVGVSSRFVNHNNSHVKLLGEIADFNCCAVFNADFLQNLLR